MFIGKTVTIQNPRIYKEPRVRSVWLPSGHGTDATNTVSDTAGLEEHWGKPAKIRPASSPGGGDIWTYKFGCRWSGVIAVVLLPVPIAVPVGRAKVSFLVQDGRIVSAEVVRQRECGRIAGCVPGICGFRWGVFPLEE